MTKQHRIIQVGLGVRGRQWAKVIGETPNAEVAAFVALELDELRATAREIGFGETPCYDDLARAVDAHQADVLLLVSPPEVHHQQALLGFKHGLHLLSEKPLTEDLEESMEIVKRGAEANRLIGISMNFRYLPASQRIRGKLAEKALGEPAYSQFTYLRHRDGRRPDLNKYPLTMEQPMLLEQSIHHLDLMRYCFGSDIEWVQASTWNPSWSTYEDDSCVAVLMKFENGMHANYQGTWTAGTSRLEFRWRIDCSEGTLIQQQQFKDLNESRFDRELAATGQLFKPNVEIPQPVELPKAEAFIDDSRVLLRRFLSAIEQGTPFETDGLDHVKSLAAIRACIESAQEERRIPMQDFYARHGINPTRGDSTAEGREIKA